MTSRGERLGIRRGGVTFLVAMGGEDDSSSLKGALLRSCPELPVECVRSDRVAVLGKGSCYLVGASSSCLYACFAH